MRARIARKDGLRALSPRRQQLRGASEHGPIVGMRGNRYVEASTGLPPTSADADQQFALLLDLTREISEGATLERIFALVADSLRQVFEIDRFAVVLVQPDGSLRLTASRGLSSAYMARVQQRIEEGAGARALAERKPAWILDAPSSPHFWPLQEAARAEGFRSVLILPLFSRQEPLGYIIMYHDEIRTYTPAEIMLAQAFAQQAAFAVQSTRLLAATERHRLELEQRFQQRVAEAEAIDQIVLRIAASLDLGSTLQSITDAAAGLSGAPYSTIFLRDVGGNYCAMAAHGVPLDRLQRITLAPSQGLMSRLIATRQPSIDEGVAIRSRTGTEAREEIEATGTRLVLGIPMLQGDEVVGALYVGKHDEEPFSADVVTTLRRLTSFAQVALQNARRFSDVEAERTRLQAYVDAIPEGVIVFDRDGRVVLTNETLKRDWRIHAPMVGLLREEVFLLPEQYSSRPLKFRFDPAAVFKRVLRTGQPEQGLLELEDSDHLFEMHFGALRGGTGEVDGIVATIRDVTVPLELGRERSRSALLAQLLDISVLLNSNLSVAALMERVVEAGMSLLGATAGTLGLIEGDRLVFRRFHTREGWTDLDVTLRPGEGAPGYVWQSMRPYISNDPASDPRVMSEVQRRLGFRRLVIVPMMDSAGTLIGTLGVYDPLVERDFTQTDAEALQLLAHHAAIAVENARLNELKDEFLSIVSHELKTPVTSIKGFAQVLKRRLAPDPLQSESRYLDVINRQADRLTVLINDLLDLSRIQTGRFSFDLVALDYGELVREVVEEMQMISGSSTISVSGPESVTVQGNEERLRQVLINLIDNGIKHGPSGGDVHVTIEAGEQDVVTYVCDEGRGLPPGEEERIFRQYYQVRQHRRHQAKGLGLGLFISRQIVEEHQGRIWLDTADHTSFCFTLPRG